MSIFTETIARAISDYRYLLRRNLPQSERVAKLQALELRDPELYEDEIRMYRTALMIVSDIEENMDTKEKNYYSYSGIGKFSRYLREYLDNYEIENGKLIHKAQKASRAMIEAIQLISLSTSFDDELRKKLIDCNKIVLSFGSSEQQELYKSNLEQHAMRNEDFFAPIIYDLNKRLQSLNKKVPTLFEETETTE